MKYKLINDITKEEHLCDKVTIYEFDYYVINEEPTLSDTLNTCYYIFKDSLYKREFSHHKGCKKVIATNNPNIDISKIINKIDLTKLCYYDRRNPDFSIKEEYGYDKEEVEATGNFAKKDCICDNCFYGRSQLTEQLIKSQETHPFSEEDMIEFNEFSIGLLHRKINGVTYYNYDAKWITTKELFLNFWKEKRVKILYYE